MFLSGLSVQKRVVHALFLRELKTRFGKYRLGYLWALLEPVAHLAVLMLIFGYVMSRVMPEISFLVFLVNGLVPWFLFSNITSRSLTAIEANRGLLSYAPVHPVDTLLSRTLLESMIYVAVYVILMAILWLQGESITLINVPRLLSIWLAITVLSMGLGLIFMVIGHAFNEAQKILPIILKPLYFISGIMFSINIIPQQYHYLVDWNPLLHAFELLRQTVVPAYQIMPSLSLGYLWQSAVVVLAIGLIVYKGREPAILRSS
ncbi:ABC transporter permease [Neisseriaceae bacterium CLB008]